MSGVWVKKKIFLSIIFFSLFLLCCYWILKYFSLSAFCLNWKLICHWKVSCKNKVTLSPIFLFNFLNMEIYFIKLEFNVINYFNLLWYTKIGVCPNLWDNLKRMSHQIWHFFINLSHFNGNVFQSGFVTEAVVWRCSIKKVFLEISQNS